MRSAARGAGAAGPGGARTRGTGAARAGGAAGVGAVGAARAGGVGGSGAGGAAGVVAGDPGAEGTGAVSAVSGGAARPHPYYVPLLQQVLGLLPSTGPTPPLLSPPPVQSQWQLQPASPLPGPSPYSGQTRGLTERREPESRPASPESRPASPESRLESPVRAVRTGRRVLRQRPPPIPGTHSMTLRPSTAPQRVPLPSPPASSLPDGPDPESDSLRAASPTVTRFLATAVTAPSFESTAASAQVADLVDFVAACLLDYAASLVAESESSVRRGVKRPSGSPPVFKVCYRDYELHSLDFNTAFLQGSLHEEIWLRSPPGFTGSFPAGTQWSLRRPVYGLRQAPREWHDTLRTTLATLGFAPSTADPSLFLRTDTTLPPFYVLVYVDDLVFATADTEALAHVKSELQKRHTCTDLGELTSYLGLRITRDRAQRNITLTQSHMVQQVLQRFGFRYSSPQSTPLPTDHSLSAPPSDESVEPSGPYPELVGCLITKHIALRYFLARELQQRGQLRLAYVASWANIVDVFTKALQPCDHQRFCTVLGLWLTLDGAARLAVRNHPPLADCARFGQHKTAKALYDCVVARYSSPTTAALGHLILPYWFPELSAFATVEDLVTHLCTRDARYRAALPV
ncbi:unnamed protein product [Closterium sp. NIES-53]